MHGQHLPQSHGGSDVPCGDQAQKDQICRYRVGGIFAEGSSCISEHSAQCLTKLNIDFSKFQPRQLKHKMIENAYLVFCMTDGQKELLNGFENVYSISEVAGFQIPDPYGGTLQDYERTAALIRKAVCIIIDKYFTDVSDIQKK